MIKSLAHVCLLSRDLEKTLDFYCGTLGLKKGFDFLRNGKLFGFYVQVTERQFIEIFQAGDDSEEAPPRRITHFCLEVNDVEAMRSRLVERGIEVTEKKLGADHSWQIWCKDPDGTSIEFHQYTPESTQLTGKACLVNW
jgi:lactoylglutathione lyase/glyoxylase I family protein